MSDRSNYIQQVVETCLFFRDMHEEGMEGHTGAIQLLKPDSSVSNVAVRKFLLGELYGNRRLGLTESALEFAKWQPAGRSRPSFYIEDIQTEISDLCARYERKISTVGDKDARKERAFLRASRYIERISKGLASAHSRVVELFIPEDFVPRGGQAGAGHREHVVPCVCLRDEGIRLFKCGASLSGVADFLKRHVAIVEICKRQQKYLDGSKLKGGCGLKNAMPVGWRFDVDCIFARLHYAGIDFDLPPEYLQNCTDRSCEINATRAPTSTGLPCACA